MNTPITDRHPAFLWEGFWGIQLLHAGQTLGLFQALSEPCEPAELASKLQLEPRYTETWCAAAAACGLLRRDGDRFHAPHELADWLADSRGFTESHLHLSQRLNETFQAIFSGRALPEPPISLRLILNDSLLQNYRWVFETVPGQVPAFASALQNAHRALEVGCGIGLGLGVLRSHYSNLDLYGLESDYECAREAERATRAVIHLGDSLGDRYVKPFDLVLCFRRLASAAEPEQLLSECARLLSPEGWLILGSEVQDQAGVRKSSARSLGELFAYQMLAGVANVNFFSREQLIEMIDQCGLQVEAEVQAPDWGTPLYLCRRQDKTG